MKTSELIRNLLISKEGDLPAHQKIVAVNAALTAICLSRLEETELDPDNWGGGYFYEACQLEKLGTASIALRRYQSNVLNAIMPLCCPEHAVRDGDRTPFKHIIISLQEGAALIREYMMKEGGYVVPEMEPVTP